MPNYQKTKLACYLGFITQAITANFAPLLFLKFHHDYNISLGNIALISTCFFFTQLLVDAFCAKYVDRIGYRVCIVASEICAGCRTCRSGVSAGSLLPDPFIGIMCSVIIYAVGSGLIEVLCGPIVEACPFENKEATMSLFALLLLLGIRWNNIDFHLIFYGIRNGQLEMAGCIMGSYPCCQYL